MIAIRDDGGVLTVRVGRAPYAAARTLLTTAEIVLGTTVAHTVAGGQLPSLLWLAGLTAVVYAVSWRLDTTKPASLGGLIACASAVTAAQFGLHAALAGIAHPEHVHGAAHTTAGDLSALELSALELSAPMIAAHTASALLTLLVWRIRRRALQVVLDWNNIRAALPRTPGAASTDTIESTSSSRYWTTRAPRRGPPRPLLVA